MNIVKKIRKKINTGKKINIQKIENSIKEYKVISFDIFDTLLKRNVSTPEDVFAYVEKKYNIPDFTNKRINAEIKARKKHKEREINIRDIYIEYGEDFSIEELSVEEELITINRELVPLFKYCVENKRVILVSDMYLPEKFISKILLREGIVGYEKLFLSSSLNKTKKNGDMYEYVLDNLKIDKNEIIHIGDSIKSDYIVPRKKNIDAIHIPKHIEKTKKILGNTIEEDIINNFINNTILYNENEYYKFGYEKFGMFLWGYSKWLHTSILEAGIKNIYFFSRDGLIMKKAFDTLYSDVNTYYIEVSRRALRVPILWMNYDFEHVLDMISPSKLISLTTIFDGVGLPIENYTKIIKEFGFNLTDTFDRSEICQNKKLIEMYNKLGPEIEKTSKKEYELLEKYINQNKLAGKFAIVDIGWSGGMQRYLSETLNKLGINHEIKGYYIGVADYFKRNKNVLQELDLNGYLFDFSHNENEVDKRKPFVGLFETLFLEQNGSVKNYIEENNVVRGNRLPYEYIQDGKPTYELKCIQEIQRGALEFIKNFGDKDIYLSPELLFKGIEKTGLNPTRHDLKLFANFRFFDEGETQFLAKPKKNIWYLFHIKEFKEDFLKSRWKIGFMKRIFKINLPYEKIFNYLIKFK